MNAATSFRDAVAHMMAEEDDDGSIETCNITYEPLTKSHIRLNCGHAFNYRPLYIDVFGQRFGDPYDPFVVLRNSEEYKIFCPYCRVQHNKPVLPFVVEPGTALTYSVNTLDLAVYKHFISCHAMQGIEHNSIWFVRGLGCLDCLAVYGAFLPDSLAHYCGHHYFRRRTEARRRAAALEKAVKRATMNQRTILRTAEAVDRATRAVERATRAVERDAKAAERIAKRVAKGSTISPKTMETRPSNTNHTTNHTNHTNSSSSKLSIAEEKRDAAVRAYELAQQKAALSERAVQDMTPSL